MGKVDSIPATFKILKEVSSPKSGLTAVGVQKF